LGEENTSTTKVTKDAQKITHHQTNKHKMYDDDDDQRYVYLAAKVHK
jgi:hypothetical protein